MQPFDAGRELDAHREPLRRLAAALIGDGHEAEDVVQDAFASVLSRGEPPGGLSSWLRAVVRRLALDRNRRLARRTARERAVARPEAFDETDSTERLELVEMLLVELRSLDEPYRRVLTLRYVDGIVPTEIAARLDISPATVDSRLQRGLARLRERLDRRGGRERWLSATAAWIRPAHPSWKEILLMNTATKAGVAAAMLLIAWLGWRALPNGVIGGEGSPSGRPASLAEDKNQLPAPPREEGRSALAFELPEPTSASTATAAQLAGVVVDEHGNAVANVTVGVLVDGEKTVRVDPIAKSGADGRFALEPPTGDGVLLAIGAEWFTLGSPPYGSRALPCERVVCVVPRQPLTGIVVNRDGVPIQGARIEIVYNGDSFSGVDLPTEFQSFSRATTSAEDGTFRIEDAPAAHSVFVAAKRRGTPLDFSCRLTELRELRGRIVLDYGERHVMGNGRIPPFVVRGKVVDASGQPMQSAFVAMVPKVPQPDPGFLRPEVIRADKEGLFEFPVTAGAKGMAITASAAGRRSVTVESDGEPQLESSWPAPLVFQLEQTPLSIRGRVIDANGQPCPDGWIDLLDATPFGTIQRTEGWWEPRANYSWETFASGRDWMEHVELDQQGRFEFGELGDRTYRLIAFDPISLEWALSAPIAAGSEGVELTLEASPRLERVAGRVVDSAGVPVAGVSVTLSGGRPKLLKMSQQGTAMGLSRPQITAEDGRFEFRDVCASAGFLRAEAPTFAHFGGYTFLSNSNDLEDVVIVLPRVTFAQLELSDPEINSRSNSLDLYAVDARNMILNVGLDGTNYSQVFVHDSSRTRVFPVADTARKITVRSSGQIVFEIPVELEFGKVNLIRR